jgi:hypothetical protein
MKAAVTQLYVKGCRIPDEQIEAAKPVVGNLSTYTCPREPGGTPRTMAGLSIPAQSDLIKPILEPRLTGIHQRGFVLRGLEEFRTERGWVYTLQEWIVEEAR